MKFSINIIITALLCLCFFIVGILTDVYILNNPKRKKNIKKEDVRSFYSERKFTSPLLDCEPDFNFINPNLEKIMLQKALTLKKNPTIEKISIYFRDLNNGSWYGVNEREKFIPASLNKVPLMIAAFKLSEEYPEVLTFKFLFEETTGTFTQLNKTDTINVSEKIFNYYDLIEYMIQFSHNETAGFLIEIINSIDKKFVDNIFTDLGMSPPSIEVTHQLTTKDYASFFRVLYNSTYINNKNSEMALFFLSETEFKNGIVKGISDNIVISHKYGKISEENLLQLHDCGIVYYPENSYILCVMVKGYNFEDMELVIQDISKEVYTEVKRQVAAAE